MTARWYNWDQKPILEEFRPSQFHQKTPQLNSKVIFFQKQFQPVVSFATLVLSTNRPLFTRRLSGLIEARNQFLKTSDCHNSFKKKAAEFKDNFLSKIISTSCVFCSPSRVYKPTPIQHDGSVASLRPENHSRLAFKWISVWVFQIDYSITFTVSLQKVRQFFI